MTIQQWRTLCAKSINPDLPLAEWASLVNTITRLEATARKQQEWMEKWVTPF